MASFFGLSDVRHAFWNELARTCQAIPDEKDKVLPAEIQRRLLEFFSIEKYWGYPGDDVLRLLKSYADQGKWVLFGQLVRQIVGALNSGEFETQEWTPLQSILEQLDRPYHQSSEGVPSSKKKPTFDVLVVHPMIAEYAPMYSGALAAMVTEKDEFLYRLVFVDNSEDAWTAVLANPMIQSCVLVPGFGITAPYRHPFAQAYDTFVDTDNDTLTVGDADHVVVLSRILKSVRPEVDQFLISGLHPAQIDSRLKDTISRIIYSVNPFQDLHHGILNGIRNRYSTPFFHALLSYSRKPKEVFHALPISQGKSVKDSHWIDDIYHFYGPNVFMAETSSTQGGLDSLMDPKGAIKQARDKAAVSFGSDHSFFVTNGTSTSNKIVMQSTVDPGDIVLVASDCHKSVPYSVMLAGAYPIFLENMVLDKLDLYGPVPLAKIKSLLYTLESRGCLHRVKQIVLTHCTFDGILYDVERFMLEILAIKPDIIFHWDEAWFATGNYDPVLRSRSTMAVTRRLRTLFASPGYRADYAKSAANATRPTLPDPDAVVLRVYVTQSTHKTLSSFRQGSMIHVMDARFDQDRFIDSFRMHSSTSPNYQIIASLDVSRRQMDLEGFRLVKRSIALAEQLRNSLSTDPILKTYFKTLTEVDLAEGDAFPNQKPDQLQYPTFLRTWKGKEFVVDPTRVTLDIRKTGLDGSSFRQLLISKYDIQVNKTSRYTVLFIVNIGATPESITHLISVLRDIASRLSGPAKSVPNTGSSLPLIRKIHPYFQPPDLRSDDICDLRRAYYAGLDIRSVAFSPISKPLLASVRAGAILVSAGFVTPYPPGFPLLIPGQIVTIDILEYLHSIKIKEIHGYRHDEGLRVFTDLFFDERTSQ
jgi:arginine decarboxylase